MHFANGISQYLCKNTIILGEVMGKLLGNLMISWTEANGNA
jgi:hypothetical protein